MQGITCTLQMSTAVFNDHAQTTSAFSTTGRTDLEQLHCRLDVLQERQSSLHDFLGNQDSQTASLRSQLNELAETSGPRLEEVLADHPKGRADMHLLLPALLQTQKLLTSNETLMSEIPRRSPPRGRRLHSLFLPKKQ